MAERALSSLILYCLLLLTIALFPLESEARILAEIHKDGNGIGSSKIGVDPIRYEPTKSSSGKISYGAIKPKPVCNGRIYSNCLKPKPRPCKYYKGCKPPP